MKNNKILRKKFVERNDEEYIPDLIELQKKSYNDFLGSNDLEKQKTSGIYKCFKKIFPIKSLNETIIFDFVSYRFDDIKYTSQECLYYKKTYSAPLYVVLRLYIYEKQENGKNVLKTIKDQDVYLCDLPLMTENGNFIFSGIERIIVSQLIKAPGVVFDKRKKENTFEAKIIPMDGTWLGFEFDNTKGNIYFKLDGRKKLPITALLRVLNLSNTEIFTSFYKELKMTINKNNIAIDFDFDYLTNKKLDYDLIDYETNKVLISKKTKLTKNILNKIKDTKKYIMENKICDKFVLLESVSDTNKNILVGFEIGKPLSLEMIAKLREKNITSIKVVNPTESDVKDYIYRTFKSDEFDTKEKAAFKIYESLRNGERPQTLEQAEKFINKFIFDIDLSKIGRMKMNHRLGLDTEEDKVTIKDIIEIIKILSIMKFNEEKPDDIDSLQNRRVRLVGESVQNQFLNGLKRIVLSVQEKLNTTNSDSIFPRQLINFKPLMSAINDLFAVSQLSQFMDQTNPLSELSHKRRITLLGPNGLKRDRAISDVRDIHYTQYGKICPTETPEGQNIGLVNNLALMSKIDEYGFITTPYKKVINGVVQNEVIYLSALEEEKHIIANSDAVVDKNGEIRDKELFCRCSDKFEYRNIKEVTLIEVSPKQILSVAANLIPFIGNDHSNRCLMASAMLRQAVPFIRPEFPLVGTGIENKIVDDIGVVAKARKSGVVKFVDSTKIIVETDVENSLPEINIYELDKFRKTNNDTTINQYPIVEIGQNVNEGDFLTNAQCVDNNELSLGKNAFVAFMSYEGYNFGDSIVISDRLIQNETFNSIHIEEFEVVARDTQLGPEEITRYIPNVSEDALRKLDESGIIHIGAEVKVGDILVGKTTPKADSPITPEEKLLKVIFGEKSNDVKDTSLYVTPGTLEGTVVDVKVFTRQGLEKDERAEFIEDLKIQNFLQQKEETLSLIKENIGSQIFNLVEGKILNKSIKGLKKGEKLTKTALRSLKSDDCLNIDIDDKSIQEKISNFKKLLEEKREFLDKKIKEQIIKVKENEDLGQNVLKVVKILIASKQRLQPGDKMTGRHGNKGVISKIVPVADMPYMEDGTPIDVLLTPSGIPSRMNIGQILETHLGWASANFGKQLSKTIKVIQDKKEKAEELKKQLLDIFDKENEQKYLKELTDEEIVDLAEKYKKGIPFATGTFEKIKIEEIENLLEKSGVDKSGQVVLYDGRTGEPFERKVTVGYMYMLKLHHLVDTKIHARSIGPYSLVTQQPLGGKAHFGGQRFGEMECWALQGYGAAYNLQEMLTLKSDDVIGRVKIYDSIVHGNQNFQCGIPESFNVMIKELRALGLNVELIKD